MTASELNVREQADKNSSVLGKLANKQVIEVENMEGNWAKITFVDESGTEKQGYISTKYITPVENIASSSPKDNTFLYTVSIIGLIALICYIIALIKTRNGEMTTIANWYDFALLCASFVIPCIGLYLGSQEGQGLDNLAIGGFVIGGVSFLGSIAYSIKENSDNYFHAFLSIVAKLFVVMVMIVVILIILYNMVRRTTKVVNSKTVSMSVYEQRNHDNNRARNIKMASSVGGFLVLSLIGSHLNRKNNESI